MIKGLVFTSALMICAILVYNFSGTVGSTGRSKPEKSATFEDTRRIYYLQEKEFTYQVLINDSITDTISLRTYPLVRFDQGVVVWYYRNVKGEKERQTGVIENDSVIWLHPPRDYNLDVLTIVAFPAVKKPIVVGSKWDWHLDVTDKWAPARLKSKWNGLLSCNFTYEVTRKDVQTVLNSQMLCYTIETISNSKMGITHGYHVFNSKFGFVELYYPDIFGIRLKVKLISVAPFVPVAKSPPWDSAINF